MLGWLYRAIVGRFSPCQHRWRIEEMHPVKDSIDGVVTNYHRYILQCSHCGEIVKRDMK